MKKFNKSTVHSDIQAIRDEILVLLTDKKCNKTNVNALFANYLDEYEPKSGGGQAKNPPIELEDGTMQYYCRYVGTYMNSDLIVMSNGKSKGYSKVGIARWTKMGKDAKALESEALKCFMDSMKESDEALSAQLKERGEQLSEEANDLLLTRNKQETYADLKEQFETID